MGPGLSSRGLTADRSHFYRRPVFVRAADSEVLGQHSCVGPQYVETTHHPRARGGLGTQLRQYPQGVGSLLWATPPDFRGLWAWGADSGNIKYTPVAN